MTVRTLAQYLAGQREAILAAAACPAALWVGLMFILAAGFAREYDGQDLLHAPWHLLVPLGASLATSAALYLLVRFAAWTHHELRPTLISGYRVFLSLYWLTAPLALLYAIPVERFLTAGDAMRANLWLLAIVASWRVLLMSRVIAVLYSVSFASAFVLVMLFADSVVLLVLYFTPLPIFNVMGGIRLSDSEQTLQGTAFLVGALGVLSWPVWLIGSLAVLGRSRKWSFALTETTPPRPASRSLVVAAAVCVGIWIFILPFTQPEQLLRHRVETALLGGEFDDALAWMSAHEPEDFPPHWDPPPRIAFRHPRPDIVELLGHVQQLDVKPWVRKLFERKFVNHLRGNFEHTGVWPGLSPEQIETRLAMLERVSLAPEELEGVNFGLEIVANSEDLPQTTRDAADQFLKRFNSYRSELRRRTSGSP